MTAARKYEVKPEEDETHEDRDDGLRGLDLYLFDRDRRWHDDAANTDDR